MQWQSSQVADKYSVPGAVCHKGAESKLLEFSVKVAVVWVLNDREVLSQRSR